MKYKVLGWQILLTVLFALTAGCAPSWVPFIGKTSDLQVENVRSIKTIAVRRIAVLPLIERPGNFKDDIADGATETITAEIIGQMALAAGWELVPESDVAEVLQKMPPVTLANLQQSAAALGKAVSAEQVLFGTVDRFKERVGLDYAAASPAAVSFTLQMLDRQSGEVVWTAKFARAQKALIENIFNLGNFIKNSGRWVKAHEIALEGVQLAVNDLHGKLSLNENINRFPSASYEQYRMGVERFNRNPN